MREGAGKPLYTSLLPPDKYPIWRIIENKWFYSTKYYLMR
jgi:hypothetical protein